MATPLLILITGKSGSGKSTMAQAFAGQATILDVDQVIIAGAAGMPNPRGLDSTEWGLWQNAADKPGRLLAGLRLRYGQLVNHPRHLIAEGAILCNDWFHDPWISALSRHVGLEWPEIATRRYYLDVPNEVLLVNCHRRGRTADRRFNTVHDLADYHRGFDEAVRQPSGRWKFITTASELDAAIRADLGGWAS